MNNKGFTLVEVIATIALLAIISIISFVAINAVLDESKSKDCESLVSNITSAAKEYVSDNRYAFTDNSDKSITAGILISGNYLSGSIVDPFSKENVDPEKIDIDIVLNDDYTASEVVVKSDGVKIDCNNKKTFEYATGVGSGANVDDDNDDDSGNTGTGNSSSGNSTNIPSENISGGLVPNEPATDPTKRTITVVDKSGDYCADAIEYFYTEGQNRYYFTCIKSHNMYVVVNGVEYGLVYALENKIVTMAELESNGYKFMKETLNLQDK